MARASQRYQFNRQEDGVKVTLRVSGDGRNNTALKVTVIPYGPNGEWPSAQITQFIEGSSYRSEHKAPRASL